jgi:hypothetical protein
LVNAEADATIAIAGDMETAGERLTRKAVRERNRTYCPIHYRGRPATHGEVTEIRRALRSIKKPEITVNIAGNSLHTLRERFDSSQQEIDKYAFDLLRAALTDLPGVKVTLIRSGGQTGFDEAGIKAGMSLGIPTEILAPQGWKMRDQHGVDRTDELSFKRRFVLHLAKERYRDDTYGWDTYCYDNDEECNGWNVFGLVRNDQGMLEMRLLSDRQCEELSTNVHAFFDYELVMLDVHGCAGHRYHFQKTYYLNDALRDLEDSAFRETEELIGGT